MCLTLLTGKSVHNAPIERFWRDLMRCVIKYFVNYFKMVEDNGLWHKDSDVDVFCLTHVFQPVIQAALEKFRKTWNGHYVRGRGVPKKNFLPELIKSRAVPLDDEAYFAGAPSLRSACCLTCLLLSRS